MSHSLDFKKNTLALGNNRHLSNGIFQKGQKILYEGQRGRVISIKPMLVIKIEDRVICGCIQKRIRCIE